MALSASTVWEVRNGGSDTNGGGFVSGSGTDWTQQDAAQYSVTDGVTNGTTTITSATASFGTDVVGNLIYVQGGTGSVAAGWYQITSRTNATTIVVDRSTGLTAGTGVTLKIGGALATIPKAFSLMEGGHIVYVKYNATAYSVSATNSVSVVNYNLQPPMVVSYDTTRTTNNTDSNRSTVQASAGSITLFNSTGFNNAFAIKNFILKRNGNTSVTGMNSSGLPCVAYNCRFYDLATGASGSVLAVNCEFDTCTTGMSGTGTFGQGCVAHACTTGFSDGAYFFCIGYSNTNSFKGGAFCSNCIAYNDTGSGFLNSGGARNVNSYVNCIASNCGAYGFDMRVGTYVGGDVLINCATYSNTSGAVAMTGSDTTGRQLGMITLSASPFTNAASQDFSLNNTAGGGAACRAAGFPGVFPAISTTGYPDVGAAQHQDSGGGSSGMLYIPSLEGI